MYTSMIKSNDDIFSQGHIWISCLQGWQEVGVTKWCILTLFERMFRAAEKNIFCFFLKSKVKKRRVFLSGRGTPAIVKVNI